MACTVHLITWPVLLDNLQCDDRGNNEKMQNIQVELDTKQIYCIIVLHGASTFTN